MTIHRMPSQSAAIWSPTVFAESMARLPTSSNRNCPSLAALQSLLIFGSVLPPLTPWASSLNELGSKYAEATIASWKAVERTRQISDLPPGAFESTALMELDETLVEVAECAKRPLVLFSGGVDSALLASRLVALGRTDTLLVHYSFGERDPETAAAKAVAQDIGLALNIVSQSKAGLHVLENPGQLYPVPFGDISTAPTNELCRALPRFASPSEAVVIDGTGADGAFGLGAKVLALERLLRLPSIFRKGLSKAYIAGGWRQHGIREYRLGKRGVADAHRPHSAIAGQAVHLAFGQFALEGNAEHRVDLAVFLSVGGNHVEDVADVLFHAARDAQPVHRAHGESRIAQPAVAVVPVARTA